MHFEAERIASRRTGQPIWLAAEGSVRLGNYFMSNGGTTSKHRMSDLILSGWKNPCSPFSALSITSTISTILL